ncbi:malto-oligosyltrehalose trehalohydrolase [Rhodospirillum rubrum]|uniref:Malto-oligosyltrehalose trehalohydrolase n=1 Tax=Rhodospirillum rubrum (strain ATCC 11170 / ATH 1.1.1 / DSM 467 / LMG 4362 / NCIMB 8255 / S1) TaxID=269796 RepID=Q2RX35_RHORT|nr:malto-oligosyltrehalose trehalohydrolase [Rhodospirillum rubrum]ABC21310.1 Glycoside hydrolase [Rhodospirillum rubrum ATCC 11170]AEO46989.1 glycoside hydrolase [Rhodospirillum rubrum F11]MBK5952898.1 malto-oligosyltrehalose trehalohydrolase [Rhodospirillum rubrum]QXG80992.1 malto-oligosyltrehalose trehalohydrolase [Rhodospirillum rubrum]HAP98987.1 malto-oligosyltrehalose trehalohydrolase [Rhodospirillum rubrum]
MTRRFGARVEGDGVRFSLWAPAAERVEVVIEGAAESRPVAMVPGGEGWFGAMVGGIGAGALYRFRIDGADLVPDPASRFQPRDVGGPSQVVDASGYAWKTDGWKGRPWAETVLYELHLGTFSRKGTYEGARARLGDLVDLGVSAIELMPLADFVGQRNWGYDGVLPFAPDSVYGTPEQLKALIDAAHGLGLMVFLDVVYNHFGPEGNWLGRYAPSFFTQAHQTPWGAAIDFERPEVRDFFVANALQWLEEYRFDGLRFDAVHAILDAEERHILGEIAVAVREALPADRHVHLVLENDANEARRLIGGTDVVAVRGRYDAQWNDDIHHAFHVVATGETGGYYADYAAQPLAHLGRCLAEGFAYQGESSAHRGGMARGEPTTALPPTAFVAFLQNHDQIGNRALGERLSTLAAPDRLRALRTILLLGPQIPMLFMGEEWSSSRPFLFFCDFHGDLAEAVREGRRREFAAFPQFSTPETRDRIPDPNAPETARACVLDWSERDQPTGAAVLAHHKHLLELRFAKIVPLLGRLRPGGGRCERIGEGGLAVRWGIDDGRDLLMLAQLAEAGSLPGAPPQADLIYRSDGGERAEAPLGPWSVLFALVPETSR